MLPPHPLPPSLASLDFTGHPYELGGTHFTLTLLWSQISAVISVVLYQQFYNEENRRSKISAIALYSVAGSLVFVWTLSFYCFIKKINPKYYHTFFGTTTGIQYSIHLFRYGNERTKKDVFSVNSSYLAPIRDEVRAWTMANWERWKVEKPDWFTEHWISALPDEFIPHPEPNRRRSSAFLNLLGLSEGIDGSAARGSTKNTSKVAADDGVE